MMMLTKGMRVSSRWIDATRFCGHSARRGPGHLAAATVAEVYKQRWAIELFFKALKQSLRIKTFVGTSANALKTQIWAALIAMLLIKCLQLKATLGWSLSNLVALLRQQLFVYRELWVWIDHPFQAPEPPPALPHQLAMAWQ
jgi:IS4 transposase